MDNKQTGLNDHVEQCPNECTRLLYGGSYQGDRIKILHGLRRVEGQVRGIQRMVEEDRYCVDVLNQIAAARMALARLALIVLEDHTRGCVSRALAEQKDHDRLIRELMDTFKKMI